MIAVRPLTGDDLESIAYIHTRVWQTAYKGHISKDYLDSLDPAERLKKWRAIFEAKGKDRASGTLVAWSEKERAGFLSYGPARDKDRKGWAEIYAVYVLQDKAGCGAGYALFDTAHKILREQNYDKAYLWALESNQSALRSYKKWGGVIDPQRVKQTEIGGKLLKEISVSFDL